MPIIQHMSREERAQFLGVPVEVFDEIRAAAMKVGRPKVLARKPGSTLTLPDTTTPEALALRMGWSPRRVRTIAKNLRACRLSGNRMTLTKEDVDVILEASRPCPSSSISAKEVMSGTTAGRLPATDYEARLAQRAAKPQRALRPRSKTDTGKVVSIKRS